MDQRLIQQLRAWNPWWREGVQGISRFNVPTFHREQYEEIRDVFLRLDQAVSVVGMRQVGKTTIMHQCIKELLEKGIPPENIFHISFEDTYLQAQYGRTEKERTLLFDRVIREYAEHILQKRVEDVEQLYFFFDEVHLIPDWEKWVKSSIDRHAPIAFMVSGSASFDLQERRRESLLGRMREFTLYPFSFREIVDWQTADLEKHEQMVELVRACRVSGDAVFQKADLQIFFQNAQSTFRDLAVWYDDNIKMLFRKYILYGGFPRVWDERDEHTRHRYLIEQHLQKVIRDDLPRIANVRKTSEVETLYISILDRIGEETIMKELGETTNIKSPTTLSKYLRYLEKSFLLFPVERTKTANVLRMRRASRVKFYALDVAVRAAIHKRRDDLFEDATEMGCYAENLVASALYRRLNKEPGSALHFYRIGSKESDEVDFIVKYSTVLLPIEVKYRNQIPALKALDKLTAKWDLGESVVVTKDQDFTYRNGRLSIPLWFFLLCF